MTQHNDIQSLHWQPALGGAGIVENIDDIHQSIRIILRTSKGSDPLRPEFGSNLHLYLDSPINRARPHVVRECMEALRHPTMGEPRIVVERVDFSLAGDAHASATVFWRLADGFAATTEVAL
ncbi:MAG: GPW/gp25 family protein [Duganella sp.]